MRDKKELVTAILMLLIELLEIEVWIMSRL